MPNGVAEINMKPIAFKESNKNLSAPSDMTEKECGTLPIFTDGTTCVSKWQLNFKDRIHCLLYGYLWIRVHSGQTQPPIGINAKKTIFAIKKT